VVAARFSSLPAVFLNPPQDVKPGDKISSRGRAVSAAMGGFR
jgi:hypothetical protein